MAKLDNLFKNILGDMVFRRFETASTVGETLIVPQNYTLAEYYNKFIVTTNKRAGEFAKKDSNFKRIGKFDSNGDYSKFSREELINDSKNYSVDYSTEIENIKKKISETVELLKQHKQKQSEKPENFGFLGDINYVSQSFDEIIQFLKSSL